MATVVYDGLDGFENISETAKEVLKGGAIGAATGLAVVFITNKIPFLARMSPIIKGVVQLGMVVGVTALAKDKVGEEVATGMGVGGASVVIGSLIGQLLHRTPARTVATKHGFDEAIAPVIDEYGEVVAPVVEEEEYGEAVSPVIEEVDGYSELEDEGVYVEVE